MDILTIPLFPLHTVLFPGGRLPLRIFEPRYLDMISHCVKTESPFGVCLIDNGGEAGKAARPRDIGTLATVTDWNRLPDGLLGVIAEGGTRFCLRSTTVERNQLLTGQIALIPDDTLADVPSDSLELVELLKHLIKETSPSYSVSEDKFDDAAWIGFRLAEVLPLEPGFKQQLLEMSSPIDRLQLLHEVVEDLTEG
jgi:Lon protease-like protein